MSFGLDFERLSIARPLPIFDMAPTAGNETFRSSCAPNHRASQREPDRDAPPMTRVAAVRVDDDNDDRQTLEDMLKTVKRRRRVDKAKVHRALALLARDLDLFVSSFNTRLKTIGQLTFHEAPDDLRVASIARGRGEKKRSRRAGARVQRGRRNEAKREGGVEASPKPLSTTTKNEKNEKNKKTEKEEEDKGEQPSLSKRVRLAEARAQRAEKEAKGLKIAAAAASATAAGSTPQQREDPALRDLSTGGQLYTLEADLRIRTQELREARATSKKQEEKAADFGVRLRQVEGELEAERRRQRRREEADEQARVKAQRQQALEAGGDPARVSAASSPAPLPSPPPVQRRPTARLTPMAAASAASRAARRKEAAAQEAARAARPKKRPVAAVQRKG